MRAEVTTASDPVTIRLSTDEDRTGLLRLAALDSRPAPRGRALLAFVGGELRAALPLDGHPAIADPFHLSDEVVDLLAVRLAHLRGSPASPGGALSRAAAAFRSLGRPDPHSGPLSEL